MADSSSGSQSRQDGLLITAVVMTVIAGWSSSLLGSCAGKTLTETATFVIMRTASRFFVVHNYGKDDYFILAAMVRRWSCCLPQNALTPKQTLTICYVILLFILREKGIGFPMSTLTPAQMVGFMKVS